VLKNKGEKEGKKGGLTIKRKKKKEDRIPDCSINSWGRRKKKRKGKKDGKET